MGRPVSAPPDENFIRKVTVREMTVKKKNKKKTAVSSRKLKKYSLKEMIKKINKNNIPREVDWGCVGKEIL